ncbi:MAG: ParB/RepB/Spo0J family partition protein [Clostridia bacterium]|nr:ParB/RepB/Spo0J family partition protein [Clostridia bacterium]
MIKKKGLGKGLNALLTDENSSIDSDSITEIKIADIEPNSGQPRKAFDQDKLTELADSIKQYGVLSPILVKKAENDYYQIIAGERRWRASKLAGLKTIPAIIKKDEEIESYEIALIENLQRQDLNPIEEALGYRKLMTNYGMTQEKVSEKMSKSRSYVANALRLLTLPDDVLSMIEKGELSVGHAKVLLSLSSKEEIISLAKEVFEKTLSVRELESLIKQKSKPAKEKKEVDLNVKLAFETIEKSISSKLGTKVKILDKNNKGKIQIEYYSAKDLERILKIIEKGEKNDL